MYACVHVCVLSLFTIIPNPNPNPKAQHSLHILRQQAISQWAYWLQVMGQCVFHGPDKSGLDCTP